LIIIFTGGDKLLLKTKNLTKKFDKNHVLENISFSLDKGEVICFLGPSGCGKSTLLRIIAGIESFDSGEIINNASHTAFIFQEGRLLPWLNVGENIELVLKDYIFDKDKKDKIIDNVLENVGLAEHKEYSPAQLSGGMKQRVAIARALAIKPELLLMDEPFANLDFPLRLDLIRLISKLFSEKTMGGIFVTHDSREAVLMGDKIMIMTENPAVIESTIEITIPKEERYLESDEISKYNKLLNHYLCKNMGKEHMHKSCRLLQNMNFTCENIICGLKDEIDSDQNN
jgi:ABC-type nitrate/sulfonate/bicarbonate transport system ATPase subunit